MGGTPGWTGMQSLLRHSRQRTLYERASVLEYWIVDPEIDVVRIYRRAGERFGRPTELSREAGDVVTTPVLAGLELPLVSVFRE
jgi:Uma2 family endonuclease